MYDFNERKGRNNEIQVVSAVLRILERELWAGEEWGLGTAGKMGRES